MLDVSAGLLHLAGSSTNISLLQSRITLVLPCLSPQGP